MDFSLSEEQRMVQQMVDDFAEREVAPVIKEWDRKAEMAPFILPRIAQLVQQKIAAMVQSYDAARLLY